MSSTKAFRTHRMRPREPISATSSSTSCNYPIIMQLKIKLLTGRLYQGDFDAQQSIYNIKEVVGEEERIHPD